MKMFTAKAKDIEATLDYFLNNVDKAALLFVEAIKEYFEKKFDSFELHKNDIDKLESEADKVRREIKYKLYSELLIPDSRGDVLGLLETMDNVIDVAKKVVVQISIEKPEIYDFLKQDFIDLAETSAKAVVEISKAAKAFFRNTELVNDHIARVIFWEHESDKIEERLKRKAFESEEIKEFSKKVHMRYFAERISEFADEAEAVSERLAVYAIKRTL